MGIARRIACSLLLVLCCGTAGLRAETNAPAAMLPSSFDGWQVSGEPQSGSDPATLDPTAAGVLAEDRFVGYEIANYRRDERVIEVRAARFADAEGAYAAFTFYRQPLMRREKIGTLAASYNERVLFFAGNILVDARFDEITAMSGAQLRELVARLPVATGPAAALPSLPSNLPRSNLVPGSVRYLIGPRALAALNIDLSPDVVDFSKSPALLWARVNGEEMGSAELLLAAYPTPQIAMERTAAFQQLPPPAGDDGGTGQSLAVKRSGPIVAMVRGRISHADARRVLDGVHYDANVTWSENTGLGKRNNMGSVVLAALTLAGVLALISLGAGAAFGFVRFLLPRLRGRSGKQGEDEGEMIRLGLE